MVVEMGVTGLTLDPVTSTPIVILKDREGKNALTIWIGLMEASSIAMELEKVQLPRPMTHDLIRNIFGMLKVKVTRVVVCDLKDNTFYAIIHLISGAMELTIDARPSDAIAIALRAGAPIFVDEKVIEKSRRPDFEKMEGGEPDEARKKKWAELLDKMTPEEFGKYKH